MAQEQYKQNVSEPSVGMDSDKHPLKQPKGTYRYALNAVNESRNGEQGFISNEKSNAACTSVPEGFQLLGDRYIEDDSSVVIIINPETGREQIGVVQKDNAYKAIVDTTVLGLDRGHQCDIVYRVRRGNEKVIYWVDGLNRPRTFNLSRAYNFYTVAYQNYLRSGGNPDTYPLDKWDASSFDLIKSYNSIPFFSNVQVLETGNILPGSYNFAIQYIDEDLNPTEWITTSNTVNIFNDTASNAYQRIRGSRNVTGDAQSFARASKSIKLTITNLDTSFPYYRMAIIRSAGNTGLPEKALASDLYPTSDSNFLYTGNDGNLAEVALSDVLIDGEVIFAPRHIEQLENKLILSHTRGKGVNWCNFQQFASRISADLTTKEVFLNNILSEPNVKNAKSTFVYRGYMPGEVYSFGIVYIFSDGTLSPVFHIPGKSNSNLTSLMKVYELENKYLDIHNCSTDNYWNRDIHDETLVGKNVRHHRFPFRKEVNKPLYTTSSSPTTITKFKLTVNITVAPGKDYPTDVNDLPIVIDYRFRYKIQASPTDDSVSGQITDSDLGKDITIYNDLNELEVHTVNFAELDPACELASYQSVGDETFLITETYSNVDVDSSIETDISEIFGIEFSNIQKPNDDVVGFYIVRNERSDDDRMVLDNALFGAMTQFEQYKSFGLLMPKQYYTVANCSGVANSGKTLEYYNQGVWFFNPEFQFFQKKTEYDTIEVEGVYTETSIDLPTISNKENSSCNVGGSMGVYVNDVQAGTSYNAEVHKKKDKDDDGFDLLIGYRNTNISYTINNTITLPAKKRILYLNAASYQNFDASTYYNVSVDNKIGMYLTDGLIDSEYFYEVATKKNKLIYGSLIRESTSLYSNFMTRPYYKEHNNPVMFGANETINEFKLFNGDAQISAINPVSTVFYDMVVADRDKKSRVWKIVVGAVLVVAGVVLAIFSGGTSLTLSAVGASLLAGLAISYGVSLAMAGIKFEQFKSMVDVDYEKGLRDTVVDGGVFETIRNTVETDDDTIRWFSDKLHNIYMESSVPFGLRAGLTCGVPDFIDAPGPYSEEGFRSYITEKLTILDRDQGSGRLYKGYATAEFYDMNLDYLRFNKEKLFVHLPIEYDCCSDVQEIFPTRNWYSEESFQEEKTDNYRTFLPNNYRDIEGEHGEITDLYRLGNSLFIHTKEGLWHLPQNNQERVTNEIVSFIGTGAFFSIPPRKVLDDSLGAGGTQHKWGTIKTKNGVIFISEIENKIFLHSDKVSDISIRGLRDFFENNLKSFLVKQLYDKFNIVFAHDNNPANTNGVGYLSNYDSRYERVLITKKDYLILPEKLAVLEMAATKPVTGTAFTYALDDGNFYVGTQMINLTNQEYFENKSWTVSYSFHSDTWVAFHSYLPNYYIHGQNNFYSFINSSNSIWKHNVEGSYQTFYGQLNPFVVEYVAKSDTLQDKTFEDLTLQTEAKRWDVETGSYVSVRYVTFNKIILFNSRQSTGELTVKVKDDSVSSDSWLFNQLTNTPGEILASRKENNWNLNDFRDYVVDYSKPLFTTNWDQIKSNYYTDKVVNNSVISYSKSWDQLEVLRDKFIVIRVKFDNFSDVNLVLNYSLETEQSSIT